MKQLIFLALLAIPGLCAATVRYSDLCSGDVCVRIPDSRFFRPTSKIVRSGDAGTTTFILRFDNDRNLQVVINVGAPSKSSCLMPKPTRIPSSNPNLLVGVGCLADAMGHGRNVLMLVRRHPKHAFSYARAPFLMFNCDQAWGAACDSASVHGMDISEILPELEIN